MEVSCSYEFYEQFDGNHIKWQHQPTNQFAMLLLQSGVEGDSL